MAKTVGEAVTAGLRHGANVGSTAVAYDAELRAGAVEQLLALAQRVMGESPAWWRNCDGSVTVLANTEQIPLPYDFGGVGINFQVYVPALRRQLVYQDPAILEQLRQEDTSRRGDPEIYTLKQVTPTQSGAGLPAGTKMIDVFPTPPSNVVLSLKNYMRGCPAFVDSPLAPGVALGPAGALTGTHLYAITFAHLVGATEFETEGGFVSAPVSPVAQKVQLSRILPSRARTATDRLIYRTTSTGLPPFKLLTALGDNQIEDYLDNTVDGSLLPAVLPTPSLAVSGLELFPADYHETVFVDGLISALRAHVKQVPFSMFDKDWVKDVKKMWADQRSDRHVARVMPAYGQLPAARRFRQLT